MPFLRTMIYFDEDELKFLTRGDDDVDKLTNRIAASEMTYFSKWNYFRLTETRTFKCSNNNESLNWSYDEENSYADFLNTFINNIFIYINIRI